MSRAWPGSVCATRKSIRVTLGEAGRITCVVNHVITCSYACKYAMSRERSGNTDD